MALPSFCRTDATVVRAPFKETRGTTIRDWTRASSHIVSGCTLQPARSSTDWRDPAQAVTVRAVLRMPPAADVQAGDRIEVDGVRYAIDGAPHLWESPTGRVSHIECALVDWTG